MINLINKYFNKEIIMSNSGKNNTGDFNTGNFNTGDRNTGDRNTGHRNAGYRNTGHRNTGDRNTGHRNAGYRNAGYRNAGDRNTGDFNTGDWNTGYSNTGDRNTGDCNTNTPTVRLFNRDSGWEFFSNNHNKFRNIIYNLQVPYCEWVNENKMSTSEKSEYPTYKTTGGYLKVNNRVVSNKEISDSDRDFLESVPNFCPKILKECTGIDLENQKVKITIDGEEIFISRESADEFKKQFKDT